MALFNNKKVEEKTKKDNKKVSKKNDKEKLVVFVSIVPRGQGNYVIKLFESEGSNAQYVLFGEGTAQKEIRDILGIEDNSKEIVLSLLSENKIESAKKELEAFFKISKRNRGIGFSIPLTSIIGMKIYQFLVDSL